MNGVGEGKGGLSKRGIVIFVAFMIVLLASFFIYSMYLSNPTVALEKNGLRIVMWDATAYENQGEYPYRVEYTITIENTLNYTAEEKVKVMIVDSSAVGANRQTNSFSVHLEPMQTRTFNVTVYAFYTGNYYCGF